MRLIHHKSTHSWPHQVIESDNWKVFQRHLNKIRRKSIHVFIHFSLERRKWDGEVCREGCSPESGVGGFCLHFIFRCSHFPSDINKFSAAYICLMQIGFKLSVASGSRVLVSQTREVIGDLETEKYGRLPSEWREDSTAPVANGYDERKWRLGSKKKILINFGCPTWLRLFSDVSRFVFYQQSHPINSFILFSSPIQLCNVVRSIFSIFALNQVN
jgi:hypothetical protein